MAGLEQGGIPPEEREENKASQRDELEALEAIYGQDFQVLVPVQDELDMKAGRTNLATATCPSRLPEVTERETSLHP